MILYAVGDIHGRADLLADLMERITNDREQAGDHRAALIFLGDYVDRGPESDRVLDLLLGLDRERFEVRTLLGNHDQALLDFMREPAGAGPWMKHGGVETLAAYDVAAPRLAGDDAGWAAAAEALKERMPRAHVDFLETLELTAEYGDYFFAHAGARPGVGLDRQTEHDLLWIRDDFLDDERPFEKVIVHGHTPEKQVHSDGRRIGVDTGAYASGVLSAVRLFENSRDLLAVTES
jgi:serine/threonine protein phosphatase 1